MNYVVLLGGNIGDRQSYLSNGISEISERCGIVQETSGVYETKAWGVENQQDFLNQVIIVKSQMEPNDFLKSILNIEKDLGRVRFKKWGERVIDIDILYVDDLIIESKDLIVPHPYLHERRFTLVPLVEILPKYIHPKLNKTSQDLLEVCPDLLDVKKVL